MRQYLKGIVLIVAAMTFMPLLAEMLWWKPVADPDVGYSYFGDSENWGVGSANGENPDSLVPSVNLDIQGSRNGNWDLGGKTWMIKNWNAQSDWVQYKTCLSNGTLAVTGNCRTRRGYWILRKGTTLSFTPESLFIPSEGDTAMHYINIGSGSMFDFRGQLEAYRFYIETKSGGITVVDPADFKLHATTKQDNLFYTEGTIVFPHGLKWTGGGGDAANAKVRLVLFPTGRVVAAGDFSRQGHVGVFHFDLRGGVLEATDTVTFSGVDVKVVRAGMDFIVHGESLLDMEGFTFESATPCRKFGSGTLRLGESRPQSLLVTGGKVTLSSVFNGLAGFSFLNRGIVVKIEKAGCRLDNLDVPEQLENISFECGFNLAETSAETVVFASADETILSKAKEAFRAACPVGNAIEVRDGTLVLVNSGMVMSIR